MTIHVVNHRSPKPLNIHCPICAWKNFYGLFYVVLRNTHSIFYYILTIELNFFVMSFDQDDDITAKVDHVGLYEAWLKNDRCEYSRQPSLA